MCLCHADGSWMDAGDPLAYGLSMVSSEHMCPSFLTYLTFNVFLTESKFWKELHYAMERKIQFLTGLQISLYRDQSCRLP